MDFIKAVEVVARKTWYPIVADEGLIRVEESEDPFMVRAGDFNVYIQVGEDGVSIRVWPEDDEAEYPVHHVFVPHESA